MRELGLRVALGAQRKQLLAAALGKPARLLVIGSALGLVLGVASGLRSAPRVGCWWASCSPSQSWSRS
jgi:hypothetical protein